MGLDFSPGGARWSYSGFHNFRHRLAREIEVDLEELWQTRPMVEVSSGDYRHELRDSEDPLFLLLNHSDCDGFLSPSECALVACRLRQVICYWPPDDYDRQQAERLLAGMEQCARTGEDLRFH